VKKWLERKGRKNKTVLPRGTCIGQFSTQVGGGKSKKMGGSEKTKEKYALPSIGKKTFHPWKVSKKKKVGMNVLHREEFVTIGKGRLDRIKWLKRRRKRSNGDNPFFRRRSDILQYSREEKDPGCGKEEKRGGKTPRPDRTSPRKDLVPFLVEEKKGKKGKPGGGATRGTPVSAR